MGYLILHQLIMNVQLLVVEFELDHHQWVYIVQLIMVVVVVVELANWYRLYLLM